jgi:hypothetical protein
MGCQSWGAEQNAFEEPATSGNLRETGIRDPPARRAQKDIDFFAWTLDDAIMAGDEAHDAEVRASAEAAEGEPSSSGRDVVELSDGEDGAAAHAPDARRETRGTKRRASGVGVVVDLTADSDGDEPPAVEEVQFVTVVDSPPRPPPALLSHINCAICMDAVGAKELASTVCGHVFCWSCIQESLKARKKCPTCRKALRATQVHRLYV